MQIDRLKTWSPTGLGNTAGLFRLSLNLWITHKEATASHVRTEVVHVKPLSSQRCEFAEWRKGKVNLNYHEERISFVRKGPYLNSIAFCPPHPYTA